MSTEKPVKLKSFSELLDASVKMYREKAKLFVSIAAMMLVVGLPLNVWSGMNSNPSQPATIDNPGLIFLLILVYTVISLAITNALIYAAAGKEKAEPIHLAKLGLRLVVPVILASLLVGLIVIGGLILLVLPGILFAIWYSFVQPVVLLEDKRNWAALKQSREYVRGRWWGVFGRLILLGLTSLIISVIIGLVSGWMGVVGDIASGLFSILVLTPITTIFLYLLYRSAKETTVSVETK